MALNTATMTGSRAIGPALAAFMVTAFGFGWCFLINGVSYAAIVGALLAMHRAELHRAPPAPRGGTPVRDGLRFVWNDRVLRRLFTVMVLVSTFGFNNQVAFPLLVDQRWHVEDWWYGVLLAAFSVGSVLGSLFVASRRTIDETMFQVLTLVLAVFTVLVAIAPGVWWALVLVVPMGLGAAGFLATGNGLTQLRTPGDMRSRILALVAVAFLGSTPIGAPITGLVGDLAGAEWALAYGAIICVGAVAWGVADARRYPASALPSLPEVHSLRDGPSPADAPSLPDVGVAADTRRPGTDLVTP
jgi:MFS family permease